MAIPEVDLFHGGGRDSVRVVALSSTMCAAFCLAPSGLGRPRSRVAVLGEREGRRRTLHLILIIKFVKVALCGFGSYVPYAGWR